MLVEATIASSPKPVGTAPTRTAEAAPPDATRPAQRPRQAEPPARPKVPEKTTRSRLTYDEELSRTFVEVVDLDTGAVVNRFPPEEIVRHLDFLLAQAEASRSARRGGSLINRVV
jgi:hypothetical protein